MTSNQHGPYVQGYTRATMAGTMGCQTARWSESHKASLSSDRGLQFALLKLESLVTADQLRGREYVLGSCTHRPSSQESRGRPNVAVRRQKAKSMIGAKS